MTTTTGYYIIIGGAAAATDPLRRTRKRCVASRIADPTIHAATPSPVIAAQWQELSAGRHAGAERTSRRRVPPTGTLRDEQRGTTASRPTLRPSSPRPPPFARGLTRPRAAVCGATCKRPGHQRRQRLFFRPPPLQVSPTLPMPPPPHNRARAEGCAEITRRCWSRGVGGESAGCSFPVSRQRVCAAGGHRTRRGCACGADADGWRLVGDRLKVGAGGCAAISAPHTLKPACGGSCSGPLSPGPACPRCRAPSAREVHVNAALDERGHDRGMPAPAQRRGRRER